MSKRASEGLWRRRREALCLGVIACVWGAPAWAEPIPAHWRSIPPVADRAGVQASVQEVRSCPDGQAGECLTLRVSNTHSFPVILEELAARPLTRQELYATSEPVEVHARGTLNLVLPLAPPEVKAWKDIAAFPVAFRVRLSDAQLGRLEALDERNSPKALSEGASLGVRMEALGRAERGVWAQRGMPTGVLDAQLERLAPLLPKLIERGCAGQVEALGEVHGRWQAGEATHDEVWLSLRGYVEWRTSARWEPRLLGCATPAVHAQAVSLAMWVEWDDLAQEISEGFEGEGPGATPEPFRGVLLGSLARRLRVQEEAALGEPPDFQDPTIVYRPLATAREWERLGGEAFPLERRRALWERAFEVGRAQVERARPEGAQMVFHLLEDERAQLEGRPAEQGALSRLLEERGPQLEFERGRLLFNIYLWDEARWPEIRASLWRGEPFAPVRSRLYLAGVWSAEHQRWVVVAAGLFLGGLALFGFSRAGERARLRAWVWLTGRGGAGAWRALVRLSGLSAQDEADARLRASGARRLMEVGRAQGDPTLAEEAAGLLASVKAAWRPEAWRVGADALGGLARGLDEGRVGQAVLEARLVERVFSGVGSDEATVLAARSLGALARCGESREAKCADADALREAHALALGALRAWEGSPKVELAPAFHARAHARGLRVSDPGAELRARVGVWMARLGPRWGVEGAWEAAWGMLRPLGSLPTGLGSGEVRRAVVEARLLSASESATTREALEVLGWARGLGASKEVQAEAVWTMARRASLWGGQDAAPWEAWEALDAEVAAQVSPARGLAARLRLLALRRLASQTQPGLWDAGWDARSVERLGEAKAGGAASEGDALALACVLDLLVEGDGGFDGRVAQAQGAERAWFLLTRALDHMAGGRSVEAAAALFEAEPQRLAPKTGARLWAARAVVAGGMGQRRAAREALGRALGLAREAGEQVLGAVDEAAAQLVGLLWAEDDARLLERAALGWLGREGSPPVPWWGLAARLAEEGSHETVLGLLRRSEAHEPEAAAQRRPVFSALARRAVREGDYTRASACAILATADERGFA